MLSPILKFDDLRQITGYAKPGDVARCLRRQGIKVFEGKSGPWTTTDLVNAAGGLGLARVSDIYNPDEVL